MAPVDAWRGGSTAGGASRSTGCGDRSCRDAVRQRRLLHAARRGDRGARERLTLCHLGLVRGIASRYRDLGLPLDDLVQEGTLGLLEAIDRYDPSRQPEFEAFARFRVRRAIRNALTDQARLVRLPKQVVERRRLLDRAEARLTAANGRTPTPAELAAATALSLDAVLDTRTAAIMPMSLDEPATPDGSPLEELVADPTASDPEREALATDAEERIRRAVARLSPRQRQIVSRHFGLDGHEVNLPTLAAELHLSERRTRTIEHDALHRLADVLEPAFGSAAPSRTGRVRGPAPEAPARA
jgi:RNA polymerase sigma factor (sigma-70 family)